METLHVIVVAAMVIGAFWWGGHQHRDALVRSEAEKSRLVDELLRLHGMAPISQESVEKAAQDYDRAMKERDELAEMWVTEVGGDGE